MALSKSLRDDLEKLVPHLRVVLPAAAAGWWVVRRLFSRRPEPQAAAAPGADGAAEGSPVQLSVPTKGPQLPLAAPPPLKHELLEVAVPVPLAALWESLFGSGAALLLDFHRGLGDMDITLTPWLQKGDQRKRVLRYTTPLKMAMGPRQAYNTEVMEVARLGVSGFVVHTRCTSSGVPFSSHFANYVQWVAVADGPNAARLLVSIECRFHSAVWGPLKAQISRESLKGMRQAYAQLATMMEQQLGGSAVLPAAATAPLEAAAAVGAVAPARPTAPGAGSEGSSLAALLQNPQTSAAAALMLVVFFVLLWRVALMQMVATQALRRVAGS